MKENNLEKLEVFFNKKKLENEKNYEKIEREKLEIVEYIKFSGLKKEVIDAENVWNGSNNSYEIVSKPIEHETLKEALKDKYDVIFPGFYDAEKGIFLYLNQYVILVPKKEELNLFVIKINTIYLDVDICSTKNAKIDIEKKVYFAKKRSFNIIYLDQSIQSLTEIKKLSDKKEFEYCQIEIFDNEFIREYINEQLSNIKVEVYCNACEELVINSLDTNLSIFNLDIARSFYKKFVDKKVGEKYYEEIAITDNIKVVIECENELGDISCIVAELENDEEIGEVCIKEKITKVNITYSSENSERILQFIGYKEISKKGVLKDFINC